MEGRSAFDTSLAREVIEQWRSTPGAALPILHDLQHRFGYIDDAALGLMAEALNIRKRKRSGSRASIPTSGARRSMFR